MSVIRPIMGGQGQGGQGGGGQQGGGQGGPTQPGGSTGVFGYVDQPGHLDHPGQCGPACHGLVTQKQGQGQQMQGQHLQSQMQGQGDWNQDDQGMYTQRGGWTPPVEGQLSQMNLQGQIQGQGRQSQAQTQGQSQEQGAVSRGGEWKTLEHVDEEPLVVHAPSGPMPGKQRNQPQNRSQEERERARRFGFPATRLLVLTDGSENSHRALEAALHFRRRNDSLFIVNAVQLMDDTVEYDQTNRLLKEKGRRVIDEVTKLIHEREIGRWECACLPSHNAKEVVLEYAQKQGIELIFIGSRGIDTKTGDFYPGSFSKYVINNSRCSVMLVR